MSQFWWQSSDQKLLGVLKSQCCGQRKQLISRRKSRSTIMQLLHAIKYVYSCSEPNKSKWSENSLKFFNQTNIYVTCRMLVLLTSYLEFSITFIFICHKWEAVPQNHLDGYHFYFTFDRTIEQMWNNHTNIAFQKLSTPCIWVSYGDAHTWKHNFYLTSLIRHLQTIFKFNFFSAFSPLRRIKQLLYLEIQRNDVL